MKTDARVVIVAVLATMIVSPPAFAQQQCPAEVSTAKAKIASLKTAEASTVEAPRAAAGARGPAVQAPRGQEQQAPRGQDLQAPRGQEQQAPRGQDVQAPRQAAGARGADATGIQGKIARAERLVSEAEQQCRLGNMKVSAEKARAALVALE